MLRRKEAGRVIGAALLALALASGGARAQDCADPTGRAAATAALEEALTHPLEDNDRAAGGDRTAMLAPPALGDSPLSSVDALAAMGRIATPAGRAAGVRLLPDDVALRRALAAVLARGGEDAWRDASDRFGAQRPDLAILGDLRPAGDCVALTLSVVDLATGAALGETPPARFPRPAPPQGRPRDAMQAAFERMIERVPSARGAVAIEDFRMGGSGVANGPGRYLADVARDAWFRALAVKTLDLQDPDGRRSSARRVARAPEGGHAVLGVIWPVSAARAQLNLTLRRDGAEAASAILAIDLIGLPAGIAEGLDPDRRAETSYLDFVQTPRGLSFGLGDGGETVPSYRICADTSPQGLAQCDSLRIRLRPERAGVALCLAVGDDHGLALLAPAAHYGPPPVGPRRETVLPDDLPPGAEGGPVVWYLRGPAGAAVVRCAVYARAADAPVAALQPYQGRGLSARELQAVLAILRDAGPTAEAGALFTVEE